MTDTKTKPHFYISKGWRECLEQHGDLDYQIGTTPVPRYYDLPVCLVSPALLDWVEKVKGHLFIRSESWARDLTIELEAIEKEFKS